jgi:hypothetical protein
MVELVIPTASISVVDYTYEEGAGAASVVITGFKPDAGLPKGQDIGN